ADLAGDAGDLGRERRQRVHHRVQRGLQLQDLALGVHVDAPRQVSVCDRRRDLRDPPDLGPEVRREGVGDGGGGRPDAADALYAGPAADASFGADLAGDARHLVGEGRQRVDHRVQGVLELQDLALRVHLDLAGQIALRDRRGDLRDPPDLRGQVVRHRVDVVGEVLPDAADAGHAGLAAEASFGADRAVQAGDLGRERRQRVHHRVDGVLQLQDLALGVDGDLLAEVSLGDGGGDLCDVADLVGQVGRHAVDVVGQVLPDAADARYAGLAAEASFGADLAGDARHLVGEGRQRVDHRVHRVLELRDLALGVDGDLLAEVSLGDGGGDLRDVADLVRQVVRHRVDVVGEVLPDAADARHVGLPAQLPLGADLAGHARHLVGERRQLVDHRVHGQLQLLKLARR